MPIDRGAKVRQVVPVIEGVVTMRQFDESHSCMMYHVEFTDAAGNASARWFLEADIKVVEPEAVTEGSPQ